MSGVAGAHHPSRVNARTCRMVCALARADLPLSALMLCCADVWSFGTTSVETASYGHEGVCADGLRCTRLRDSQRVRRHG